ncbi:serine/threonine-protein kinase [Streptomyces sp. KMM 9044]|uniref:serine/threonine-protein kinase n=1 Tax=Streptomyces sp. KMM 9044 TaxID=2744474 RepID=UPI0021516E4A|nr:serine/threonine-protein kinase [Streptomyces sp. KMM 9044]WAX77190.1 protein kinase [Streptomyces sp. KMM 9044]
MHHQDTASSDADHERLVAGRYRLLSGLGEGGMGTVWRARDEVLHREVAVKEVRAPAGLPAEKVERMYTRLEREAWAAARVTARNVVTVHDVVTDGGRPWIVMELVRGRSLADLLKSQGTLAPREAARIGAEVLSALHAAHAAGVLHRDVKPANVLLDDDGRVILSDFGIAVVQGNTALTMTGEVVGSPEYLAPEQALGRALGPATDLWSLGVLLYTAVQGRSPFRQANALSTLRAVVDEEPSLPHRAGPLAPVIEGLLRKDPAERFSAERTAQELRLIATGGTSGADTTETDTVDALTVDAPTADTTVGVPTADPRTVGVPTVDTTVGVPTADPRTVGVPTVDTTVGVPTADPRTVGVPTVDTTVGVPTADPRTVGVPTADPRTVDPRTVDPRTVDVPTIGAPADGARLPLQPSPEDDAATTTTDTPVAPVQTSPDTSPAATADALPAARPSSPHDTAVVAARTSPDRTPPAPPLVPSQVSSSHSSPTAPATVAAEAPEPVPPRRGRRKGYLLVAVAVVSALLLGGLGYALASREDGDGADADAPGSNVISPAQGKPDGSSAAGDGESDASVQQSVSVAVTGTNTTYSGSCPPPQEQAPAFTATFTVTELPVRFTYRWVSSEGSVVDRTWRTLTFPEGGPRTHRETVRVATYAQAGTLASAMGVEIRSSQQTVSDTVPFSLNCE